LAHLFSVAALIAGCCAGTRTQFQSILSAAASSDVTATTNELPATDSFDARSSVLLVTHSSAHTRPVTDRSTPDIKLCTVLTINYPPAVANRVIDPPVGTLRAREDRQT